MNKVFSIAAASIALLLLAAVFPACQKGLSADRVIVIPPPADTTVTTNPDTTTQNIPPTDTTSYYISFKANGDLKEYRAFNRVNFFSVPGSPLYSCHVEGQLNLRQSSNDISLYINDVDSIAANIEYTDKLIDSTAQATIAYYDDNGNQFASVVLKQQAVVKIKITAITATYVSGIFSGSAETVDGISSIVTPNIYDITEGVFKVKRL